MGAHSVTWLVSPHLASWQKKVLAEIHRRVPADGAAVWVLSSGTQSVDQVKCIGLSAEGIEGSARAVNAHLRASKRDRWLVAIPEYHVGGFMISRRAELSGSAVVRMKAWKAAEFVKAVERERVTLTSLVPTQIFDLVTVGAKSPQSLRAIVVGGGALDEALYQKARALGWPVLPSYGLTETASQVATASLNSLDSAADSPFPPLQVLKHARLEMREGRIWIHAKSNTHLVARANRDGEFSLEDPRRRGWLPTEDIGEESDGGWRILGRGDDVVKVLGVLVPVAQVEAEVRQLFQQRGIPGDLTVWARGSEREGGVLVLATDSSASLKALRTAVLAYNAQAPGPQRLRNWLWTPNIPRNEMGKVKKAELRNLLSGQ